MIEHKSILECLKDLHTSGIDVLYLPVNRYGYINAEDLKSALKASFLKADAILVSVQYVNNEVALIILKVSKFSSPFILQFNSSFSFFIV